MKELISFLKDIRFLLPASLLVGFELFMQSGLYRHILQPRSYADNVNHVVDVDRSSPITPNLLILGTSVAYQGVNLPLLNELLKSEGIVAQSGASEGAKLITQHTIYHNLKKDLPKLQAVLHVTEVTMPYTARPQLDPPNRSMLAQFPGLDALQRMKAYDYEIKQEDLTFFFIRSITYQKDFRDLVLSPLSRIKRVGRRMREADSLYPYINEYKLKLSAYQATTLDECIRATERGIPEIYIQRNKEAVKHHREAVRQTCELAKYDPMDHPDYREWGDRYFRELALFYNEVRNDGATVFTIFPPYSELIHDHHETERMATWHNELTAIAADGKPMYADLRNILHDPRNGDYFYDTIHLNREGSLKFTRALAKAIIKEKKRLFVQKRP